jgi:DNA replication and repair protein RecF
VRLDRLWLTDFRSYHTAELAPAPEGLTVVVGANGQGKTNLLEAIAWLATLSSFRGAPNDALVRVGAERAVVRAEGEREGRHLLIEAEVPARGGRVRVQVNRQPLIRSRDLLGSLRVSVFSPDDLALVKEGPEGRRRLLDDALASVGARYGALQDDLARVLKQRGALLKGAQATGGRLDPSAELTLDVFDARLASVGAALASARRNLVGRLVPVVVAAYDRLAGRASEVGLAYETAWGEDEAGLAAALAAARADDVRRGVSTVGPHRDELGLWVGGLPARTHASQGEQRTMALALRLAVHQVVGEVAGSSPILLLDDVFSELDPSRTEALVASLPAGQALLTTAGEVPRGITAAATVRVEAGRLVT